MSKVDRDLDAFEKTGSEDKDQWIASNIVFEHDLQEASDWMLVFKKHHANAYFR